MRAASLPVDADIGPLLEEGAVEALDLAVGLGVVGPCAAAAHAGAEARARECGATVGGAVVGEHGAHGDAALSEPGTGPLPEGDRGDRALVGEDLAVGEAGVIVDHGVDVGEADAAVTVMAVATAAVDVRSNRRPRELGSGSASTVAEALFRRHTNMGMTTRSVLSRTLGLRPGARGSLHPPNGLSSDTI